MDDIVGAVTARRVHWRVGQGGRGQIDVRPIWAVQTPSVARRQQQDLVLQERERVSTDRVLGATPDASGAFELDVAR